MTAGDTNDEQAQQLDGEDQPDHQLTGPPGSSVFSLERRPGAGLYLIAWILCGGAVGLIGAGIFLPSGALILLGAVSAAVGLPVAAGYQILARSGRPAGAYRGPSPVLLFLLVIVVVNLFGGVISLVTGIGALDVDRPEVFLVGLLIQIVGYVGSIGLFVVAPHALSWREMANAAGKRAVHIAADIANAAAVMLPVTLVALIVGSLAAAFLDARPPQVVPVPDTLPEVLIDLLGAIVLAPIGEELFFRGFALTAWWRDLGERSALVRSAVFFAVVHILNIPAEAGQVDVAIKSAIVLLVVLLPIGFVLGWLFIRRGLAASITAHMTYNGIVFGLLLLSSLLPLPPG